MKKVLFAILFLLVSTSLVFAASKKDDDDDNDDDDKTTISAQLALSTSDYRVTAGDVYVLAYAAGSSAVTYKIPVDSTYKIRVSNLAIINAAGKTFNQLKAQVEDIVTRNYPMSGVQFYLETPATFLVTVEGEINQTTIVQANALTRLSTVVTEMFTPYSSNRDIVIQSSSGTKKTYDLFKATRFGDMSQDPYLRPDDKIIVNKLTRSVTISGAVKRPGTYTILETDNLKTLVEYYANGLTDYADTNRIELTRYNQKELANTALYLEGSSIEDKYELCNLDSVYIPTSTDLRPIMFIEGAITAASTRTSTSGSQNTEASVRFNPDTNYAFLVRTYESWFGPNSDLENAFIIREGKTISIDLTKILYDRSYYSEEIVQPNDRLMIPFKQGFITVYGAVRAPGRFPFIPGRDYEYYINLAGGFNPDVLPNVKIKNAKGKKIKKTDPLTPESTITATTFSYNFNKYSGFISIIISFVSSILSFYVLSRSVF